MLVFNYAFYIPFISCLIDVGTTTTSFHNNHPNRTRRATGPCTKWQFTCRNGECIPKTDVCDGIKNCGDASDENLAACSTLTGCPKNTFRCAYGACIDGDLKCDGNYDCLDKSDELLTACPGFNWLEGNPSKCNQQKFQCRNGECITQYDLCDGKADCSDGSDETVTHCNTQKFKCPARASFRCAYGACTDISARCDKKKDCADGSDEDDTLCDGSYVSTFGYKQDPNVSPTTQTPLVISNPVTLSINSPGGCTVPNIFGTKFLDPSDNCQNYESCQGVQPNTNVRNHDFFNILCKDGFTYPSDEGNSHLIFCVNNKWQTPPESLKCVPLCKANTSPFLKTQCTYNGITNDCTKMKVIRPNTQAEALCIQGYDFLGSDLNFCQDDGKWINRWPHCKFKCGLNILSTVVLIENGVEANRTLHPWNIALYYKGHDGKTNHYCGGTLISPFAVVTAAHCVTDPDDIVVFSPSDLVVGLGKTYRQFSHPNDVDAQYVDVERILVYHSYQGNKTNFLYDVAVLELKSRVNITDHVYPACLDIELKSKNTLQTNISKGTVVGWGYNAAFGIGHPTETLQKAELPYISHYDCDKMHKDINGQESSLTKDKFCAFYDGIPSAPLVRQGDSGSGLIFKFKDRHFIYGIVSTLLNSKIATFTNLRYEVNLKFLRDSFMDISRKHNLL